MTYKFHRTFLALFGGLVIILGSVDLSKGKYIIKLPLPIKAKPTQSWTAMLNQPHKPSGSYGGVNSQSPQSQDSGVTGVLTSPSPTAVTNLPPTFSQHVVSPLSMVPLETPPINVIDSNMASSSGPLNVISSQSSVGNSQSQAVFTQNTADGEHLVHVESSQASPNEGDAINHEPQDAILTVENVLPSIPSIGIDHYPVFPQDSMYQSNKPTAAVSEQPSVNPTLSEIAMPVANNPGPTAPASPESYGPVQVFEEPDVEVPFDVAQYLAQASLVLGSKPKPNSGSPGAAAPLSNTPANIAPPISQPSAPIAPETESLQVEQPPSTGPVAAQHVPENVQLSAEHSSVATPIIAQATPQVATFQVEQPALSTPVVVQNAPETVHLQVELSPGAVPIVAQHVPEHVHLQVEQPSAVVPIVAQSVPEAVTSQNQAEQSEDVPQPQILTSVTHEGFDDVLTQSPNVLSNNNHQTPMSSIISVLGDVSDASTLSQVSNIPNQSNSEGSEGPADPENSAETLLGQSGSQVRPPGPVASSILETYTVDPNLQLHPTQQQNVQLSVTGTAPVSSVQITEPSGVPSEAQFQSQNIANPSDVNNLAEQTPTETIPTGPSSPSGISTVLENVVSVASPSPSSDSILSSQSNPTSEVTQINLVILTPSATQTTQLIQPIQQASPAPETGSQPAPASQSSLSSSYRPATPSEISSVLDTVVSVPSDNEPIILASEPEPAVQPTPLSPQAIATQSNPASQLTLLGMEMSPGLTPSGDTTTMNLAHFGNAPPEASQTFSTSSVIQHHVAPENPVAHYHQSSSSTGESTGSGHFVTQSVEPESLTIVHPTVESQVTVAESEEEEDEDPPFDVEQYLAQAALLLNPINKPNTQQTLNKPPVTSQNNPEVLGQPAQLSPQQVFSDIGDAQNSLSSTNSGNVANNLQSNPEQQPVQGQEPANEVLAASLFLDISTAAVTEPESSVAPSSPTVDNPVQNAFQNMALPNYNAIFNQQASSPTFESTTLGLAENAHVSESITNNFNFQTQNNFDNLANLQLQTTGNAHKPISDADKQRNKPKPGNMIARPSLAGITPVYTYAGGKLNLGEDLTYIHGNLATLANKSPHMNNAGQVTQDKGKFPPSAGSMMAVLSNTMYNSYLNGDKPVTGNIYAVPSIASFVSSQPLAVPLLSNNLSAIADSAVTNNNNMSNTQNYEHYYFPEESVRTANISISNGSLRPPVAPIYLPPEESLIPKLELETDITLLDSFNELEPLKLLEEQREAKSQMVISKRTISEESHELDMPEAEDFEKANFTITDSVSEDLAPAHLTVAEPVEIENTTVFVIENVIGKETDVLQPPVTIQDVQSLTEDHEKITSAPDSIINATTSMESNKKIIENKEAIAVEDSSLSKEEFEKAKNKPPQKQPSTASSPPKDDSTPPKETSSPPKDTSSPPKGTSSPPKDTNSPPKDNSTPPKETSAAPSAPPKENGPPAAAAAATGPMLPPAPTPVGLPTIPIPVGIPSLADLSIPEAPTLIIAPAPPGDVLDMPQPITIPPIPQTAKVPKPLDDRSPSSNSKHGGKGSSGSGGKPSTPSKKPNKPSPMAPDTPKAGAQPLSQHSRPEPQQIPQQHSNKPEPQQTPQQHSNKPEPQQTSQQHSKPEAPQMPQPQPHPEPQYTSEKGNMAVPQQTPTDYDTSDQIEEEPTSQVEVQTDSNNEVKYEDMERHTEKAIPERQKPKQPLSPIPFNSPKVEDCPCRDSNKNNNNNNPSSSNDNIGNSYNPSKYNPATNSFNGPVDYGIQEDNSTAPRPARPYKPKRPGRPSYNNKRPKPKPVDKDLEKSSEKQADNGDLAIDLSLIDDDSEPYKINFFGWEIPIPKWSTFTELFNSLFSKNFRTSSSSGEFICDESNDVIFAVRSELDVDYLCGEGESTGRGDALDSNICNMFCSSNGFTSGICLPQKSCLCYISEEKNFAIKLDRLDHYNNATTTEEKAPSGLMDDYAEGGGCQTCRCLKSCQSHAKYIGYCSKSCHCGMPWYNEQPSARAPGS